MNEQIDQAAIDAITTQPDAPAGDPRAELEALKAQIAAKDAELEKQAGDFSALQQRIDEIKTNSQALFGSEMNEIQMEQGLRSLLNAAGIEAQEVQRLVQSSLYSEEPTTEEPQDQTTQQEPKGMDPQTIEQFKAMMRVGLDNSVVEKAKNSPVYKELVDFYSKAGKDVSKADELFREKGKRFAYAGASDRAARTGEEMTFEWIDELAAQAVKQVEQELTGIFGGSPSTLGRSADVQDDPVSAVLKKEPVKKPDHGDPNYGDKLSDWAADRMLRNLQSGQKEL